MVARRRTIVTVPQVPVSGNLKASSFTASKSGFKYKLFVVKFEQIPLFYPRGWAWAAPLRGITPIATLERFVVYCSCWPIILGPGQPGAAQRARGIAQAVTHKGCWIFALLRRRIVAFGARGTGHEYLFGRRLVAAGPAGRRGAEFAFPWDFEILGKSATHDFEASRAGSCPSPRKKLRIWMIGRSEYTRRARILPFDWEICAL